MIHLRSPKRSSSRSLDQHSTSSTSMDLESTPRRRLRSTSSMESPVATSRDDDCSGGGVALKAKVQSPSLTPGKKIPRRTPSSKSTLQEEANVMVPLPLSSPSKKSPRRKMSGLGAFLSKYEDKEQVVYSSNTSYTGSTGSASSKGSKQSISSMPARLFHRSGRSDGKEAATSKGYASPLKGPKRGIGKAYSNRDTCSPRTAKQSLARCASYEDHKPPKPPQDESYLSHSYHGPATTAASASTCVHPKLNRGGLIKAPPRRMSSNFGIDQNLGDQVVDSYEQLLLEFEADGDDDDAVKCLSSPLKGTKPGLGKTHGRQDTYSCPSTPRQSPLGTNLSLSLHEKTSPSRCASYHGYTPGSETPKSNSDLSRHSYHGPGGTPPAAPPLSPFGNVPAGGLGRSPSQRMNDMGVRAISSYEQLVSEFEGDERLEVPLSTPPTRRTEGTKSSAVSGRVEGVRKALPGPPSLSPRKCSDTQGNQQSTAQEESPRRIRLTDIPQRRVDTSASEEEASSPRACPERRRPVSRSTSEDSITCPFQQGPAPPDKRGINRKPSTTDEMLASYNKILSDFNDSSDMEKLLACASCSSLHADNLLLLNSCNSLDISNTSFAAGEGDSCSTIDGNNLLDMKSSSALDASSTDLCSENDDTDATTANTDTTTATVTSICNNMRTAKPAPAPFRKPRLSGAVSSIPRLTRTLVE